MADDVRGKCCTKLKGDYIPPCVYSINAFGTEQIMAFADPPHWWKDGTTRKFWDLPPATVCVWPSEWMYGEDVKEEGGGFNNRQRSGKCSSVLFEIQRRQEPHLLLL